MMPMNTKRTTTMINTFFMTSSGERRRRGRSARFGCLRSLHSLPVPLEDHEGEGRAARVGDPVHHPGRRVDRVALVGGEVLAVEVPAPGALGDEEELLVRVLVGGMDLLPGLEHRHRAQGVAETVGLAF